jgi:hypothetical protein
MSALLNEKAQRSLRTLCLKRCGDLFNVQAVCCQAADYLTADWQAVGSQAVGCRAASLDPAAGDPRADSPAAAAPGRLAFDRENDLCPAANDPGRRAADYSRAPAHNPAAQYDLDLNDLDLDLGVFPSGRAVRLALPRRVPIHRSAP